MRSRTGKQRGSWFNWKKQWKIENGLRVFVAVDRMIYAYTPDFRLDRLACYSFVKCFFAPCTFSNEWQRIYGKYECCRSIRCKIWFNCCVLIMPVVRAYTRSRTHARTSFLSFSFMKVIKFYWPNTFFAQQKYDIRYETHAANSIFLRTMCEHIL